MFGMNKVNGKLILCLVMLSLVFSCTKLEKGTVIHKEHEEATQYLMMMPMTISNGKTVSTILVPYWIYDDEDWTLKVKGMHEGDTLIETIYLSKAEWDGLNIGDTWKKLDHHCYEDCNNTKERKD